MYCTSCGKQIPEDAQICAYCGKRLGGVATPAPKRLLRAREGRQIAGVCKGFANYFEFDVALVRIVWVLCAVFGLLGAVAYFAAWVVVPEEPLSLPVPVGEPNRPANY